MLGAAYAARRVFNGWNAQTYGPLLGAYHRKYDKGAYDNRLNAHDKPILKFADNNVLHDAARYALPYSHTLEYDLRDGFRYESDCN